MKTASTLIVALTLCVLSCSAFGQEQTGVKKEKRSITKEVRIEEENGVKTLKISTDENGIKTEEIFIGEAADKKMAEMLPEMNSSKEIEQRVDVRVDKIGNDKKVTITKSSNGEETVNVFEGEAADQKLKELENETGTDFSGEEKRIVVEKKEVRKEKKHSNKKFKD